MIAINQPVRLGDRVPVGDAEGQVEDIGLTYTRLRTADNRRVLIPNEELANTRVTNHTLIDAVSLAQVRVSGAAERRPGARAGGAVRAGGAGARTGSATGPTPV